MTNFRINAITKANIKIKANLFLLWKIREKACLKKAKKVFLGYRYWTQSIIIILLCRILIHPEVETVDLYHGSLKWVQLLGLDLMRLNVANITSTRLSQSEKFRLQFSFLVPLNFTFLLLFFLWSTSLTTEPSTIISFPFGRAPEWKYL